VKEGGKEIKVPLAKVNEVKRILEYFETFKFNQGKWN